MNEQLTHKEEEIMRILWKLEKAFVKDIIEEIQVPAPYNTISSIVRKLESMGLVGHETFGKTHRYYPILQKEQYKKSTLSSVLNHYFGGSPRQLLSYFVSEDALTPEEIESLLDELKSN